MKKEISKPKYIQDYVKDKGVDMMKYMIYLYERQENIKITYKIKKVESN